MVGCKRWFELRPPAEENMRTRIRRRIAVAALGRNRTSAAKQTLIPLENQAGRYRDQFRERHCQRPRDADSQMSGEGRSGSSLPVLLLTQALR